MRKAKSVRIYRRGTSNKIPQYITENSPHAANDLKY